MPLAFGAQLRSLRVAAGLTQEELAERAGLSARGIADLERGTRKSPYAETVERLCAALQLGPDERDRLLAARRRALSSAEPLVALPTSLSSFIGRKDQIAKIQQQLQRIRLLTLTGPGGIGKTRLALQATASPGSTVFVDLAPVADDRQVVPALASALGLLERHGESLLDTVISALHSKRLLLLLDNCEHVVSACAVLVDRVLRACPMVSILATSREPLRLVGETVWRVPPLEQPDSDALAIMERVADAESVRLFVDRAVAVRSDFRLTKKNARSVANVCLRLDGIPLAIELAAARVSALTPDEIDARLDDRFGLLTGGSRAAPRRHRTLRAVVDWSYALLETPEQRVFEALFAFSGGCSLDAAQAVCSDASTPAAEVIPLLANLVDRSLVLAQLDDQEGVATRYRMLETLRQYARERAEARGDARAIQDRHAEYFLGLAERAAPTLSIARRDTDVMVLEREHDNVRAAARWLIDIGDVDRAQRLGSALGEFWFARGYFSEGRALATEMLALVDGRGRTSARATLLDAAGRLATGQADFSAAAACHGEASSIWHELGDAIHLAQSIRWQSFLAQMRGDLDAAESLQQEAVRLSRSADDRAGEADGLNYGSNLAFDRADFATSRRCAQEALTLCRDMDLPWGMACALASLARTSRELGEFDVATKLWEEATSFLEVNTDPFWTAKSLAIGASLLIHQRELQRAYELLMDSLELRQRIGDREGVAWCLESFAELAAADGCPECVLQLAGAASAYRERLAAPRLGALSGPERAVTWARETLGPPATAEWKLGRSWTLERAIAAATGRTGLSGSMRLRKRQGRPEPGAGLSRVDTYT